MTSPMRLYGPLSRKVKGQRWAIFVGDRDKGVGLWVERPTACLLVRHVWDNDYTRRQGLSVDLQNVS